mmetsp:Transcript_114824/g.364919  ORF Transcript_114824/g.364919 Transcript_114824/m.364919 type:complete len:629 (-) Transcript_114824:49-1935(-)
MSIQAPPRLSLSAKSLCITMSAARVLWPLVLWWTSCSAAGELGHSPEAAAWDAVLAGDDECRASPPGSPSSSPPASCALSALQMRSKLEALATAAAGGGSAASASASASASSAEATTPAPSPADTYDVIVVGGGLVGSVVAARLAEALPTRRVLLLEAGAASQKAVGGQDLPATWNTGAKRWDQWPGAEKFDGLTRYDVPGNYEVLQCWDKTCSESWGNAVAAFQCKILGGCGVMNGALMQQPNAANFADWPHGWKWDDLSRYFEAARSLFHITEDPSKDGEHYLDNAGGAALVREALAEQRYRFSSSLVARPRTFAIPDVAAKNGIRQSTTSELLPTAMARPNFELRLGCEVLKIVHRNGRASGVVYKDRDGTSQTVSVQESGLLVVSAGAWNTPRLLLASELDGKGTVGRGLSDHTLVSSVYTMSSGPHTKGDDDSFSLRPPSYAAIDQYAKQRSGPLAQYGPTLTMFLKSPSTPGAADEIDVEVWVNPISKAGEVHLSAVLMRPSCSSGDLHLNGDGTEGISGNLYAPCKQDKETLAWAFKQVDVLMASKGGVRVRTSGYNAMNHFVGSCKLGSCLALETLLLQGSSNVAVADASALPGQVWGHPALTLTAFGYKAADMLAASLK